MGGIVRLKVVLLEITSVALGVMAVWEWDVRVRWLVALLLAALVFGAGMQYGRWQSRQATASLPQVLPGDAAASKSEGDSLGVNVAAPDTIQVHVAGAVEMPGVYELPAGSRVNEAISLAGLLPEANPNALNLAAVLRDEQRIVVPRQGEETEPAGNVSGSLISGSGIAGLYTGQTGDKVNINTAALEELDKLPGIGPVLAQRILDYRRQKGPFRTIEDLQNVSGIGVKKFEEIKELITVK